MRGSIWKKLAVVAGFGVGVSMMGGEQAEAANIDVTANVVATCTLTVTGVGFGNYDITSGTDDTAAGSLTVNCSQSAPWRVEMDDGLHQDATSTVDAPVRRMENLDTTTDDYLNYSITVGGANIGGSPASDLSGNGTNGDQVFAIDGVITAGQLVPAGDYSDTVVATLYY